MTQLGSSPRSTDGPNCATQRSTAIASTTKAKILRIVIIQSGGLGPQDERRLTPRRTAPPATTKPNLPARRQRRHPPHSPRESRRGDARISLGGRHRPAARRDASTANPSAPKRYWSNCPSLPLSKLHPVSPSEGVRTGRPLRRPRSSRQCRPLIRWDGRRGWG